MSKPKNRKFKISDLKTALDSFEKEHGDIEVLLTTDLDKQDGMFFYDTIDKFCIYQITQGEGKRSKKYVCITDIFTKM